MSPTSKDPNDLTLNPGSKREDGQKADFSKVSGGVQSTADKAGPDFSNVTGGAASTARPADGPDGGGTHTVEKGDTLSAISKKHYGNANRWQEIFNANRDQLDDPDLIQPGQVLRIP